ncbi:VOC family protein [Paenisporosarcina sp. FSL H8-0542]|uniref:VOC family protein n=1 Tax=Paenisporosarcina sp. FSL H8-0542 TaxID=2921401 RepID=UPI00315A5B38
MIELDHVVFFSKQSPKEHVRNNKGTSIGGRHKSWGTVNALTYTRNGYIEYLSVEQMDIAKQANHPLTKLLLHDLENGEGWGTICFRTENIEALNRRLKNEGWTTSGVLNAERETSTGFIRKWRMLFIEQTVSDELPLPFFIEWNESFEERMQSLREDGTLKDYNEQLQISRCEFLVKHPQNQVKKWGSLLGIETSNDTITLVNTDLVFLKSTQEKERLSHVEIN